MNDIFIKHIDNKTSEKLLSIAKDHNYSFYGLCKNMNIAQLVEFFYKYNHGNSKILWHFYYNDIIDKWEIEMISKTVKNSYPQLKKIPIKNYFG